MNFIKSFPVLFVCSALITSCQTSSKNPVNKPDQHAVASQLFSNYYNDRMKLYPLEATQNGDNRYNDLLPNNITEAYRKQEKDFYQQYSDSLNKLDRSQLDANDQMSYDVLKWELSINLEGLNYPDNLMPINQFWSLPLTMGQLGSGSGNQPFNTVKDYDNFLGRINGYAVWCDTAIANMRMGMSKGLVYPKILMERVLPEMKGLISADVKKSVFYQPILKLDTMKFSDDDKKRLTDLYAKAITDQINPSYQKLHDFIKDEYLPVCRTTAGISNIPGGSDYYQYLIKQWTTTDMTADQVFELGQKEVNRLRGEMETVMKEVYEKIGVAYHTYVTTINKQGVCEEA